MDRVAFMQQYTPMYEREKQRAMTPAMLTEQIDKAAASIADNSRQLLEAREADRRNQRSIYDRINYDNLLGLGSFERPQLPNGDSE